MYLSLYRFNRIAKKREHLKGPAVSRTPTAHKNGMERSALPLNGGSQLPTQQPRSVSPIACLTESANGGSMANRCGNLLAVPILSTINDKSSTGVCVDHVSVVLNTYSSVLKN